MSGFGRVEVHHRRQLLVMQREGCLDEPRNSRSGIQVADVRLYGTEGAVPPL